MYRLLADKSKLIYEEQVVGYATSRFDLPKIAVTMCCFIYPGH